VLWPDRWLFIHMIYYVFDVEQIVIAFSLQLSHLSFGSVEIGFIGADCCALLDVDESGHG